VRENLIPDGKIPAMSRVTVEHAMQLALDHQRAGRLLEAEAIYRQILAVQPNHPDSLFLLGMIAQQVGHGQQAVNLLRRAIAAAPNNPVFHCNLGLCLHSHGQIDQAIACYQCALELKPDYPEAHVNLGIAWRDKGLLDRAIGCYQRALSINPDYVQAHNNLGIALKEKGRIDEAILCYQKALALKPEIAEIHNNLGMAFVEDWRLDQALASYQKALALKPDFPEALNNLGNAWKDAAQIDRAIAAYRRALGLRPDYPDVHSNLLFAMLYQPACQAHDYFVEAQRWNQLHAERYARSIQPHLNDRTPDRRLRIGYLSGDFRAHASAHSMVPLIEHHDPRQVELFCYSQVDRPDDSTRRIQQRASQWRGTVGLADDQVANQIRADHIDILVDLNLHTARNRLLVLARKPAPVQVTWLGYPGSTGLSTIDYRLSDPYLDPPGMDESIYNERTIRLPDCFWCYHPLEPQEIPVNSLPALETGVVTFGCLNNFCKINDGVLALWAQVLGAVQPSRLLLLAPPGSHRQRTLDCFRQQGIHPEQVEFVPFLSSRAYFELYHRIDVALDTLPYNGHTTSLDSLWMGVPVVSLPGQTAVGRAGASILSNAGLDELIAQTPEQYVRIASDLANDPPRLAELRSGLRKRLRQSPLMDAPRFAKNVEQAYRQAWRDYLAFQIGS